MNDDTSDYRPEPEFNHIKSYHRLILWAILAGTLVVLAIIGGVTYYNVTDSKNRQAAIRTCLDKGGIWTNGDCLFGQGGR